jgi:hypothetical protein
MFSVIWGSYNRPDYTANSLDEINNYMDLKVLPIIFLQILEVENLFTEVITSDPEIRVLEELKIKIQYSDPIIKCTSTSGFVAVISESSKTKNPCVLTIKAKYQLL